MTKPSGSLFKSLRKPQIDDWRSDEAFARHFLEGVHPLVSFLLRDLPSFKSSTGSILGEMAQHRLLELSYSQALRLVRSLDEMKEELRGLTMKVDGQEETVAGLLETGRWFFFSQNLRITRQKSS